MKISAQAPAKNPAPATLLNTVLFGQAPPKPYQNHHLDPISLFKDGSGLSKPDPDRREKPGSIRIRNTVRTTVSFFSKRPKLPVQKSNDAETYIQLYYLLTV